jgi:hypothetical protein
MSISAVGSTPILPVVPEKAESPGPDRDGDADDAGIRMSPAQAAPRPGTGLLVDKTA